MAVVHRATLTPSKAELLSAWLGTRTDSGSGDHCVEVMWGWCRAPSQRIWVWWGPESGTVHTQGSVDTQFAWPS